MTHIADNQDALLDYLYEEGDPAQRLKIARHLQECAACSVAVLEFQAVRGMLSEWKPPAAHLGYRIVQDSATSPAPPAPGRAAWWGHPTVGRWAQAVAAVALFVAGMAVSQLRIDHSDGSLVVRRAGTPSVSSTAASASPDPAEWRRALQNLEQSLRAEMQRVRTAPSPVAGTAPDDQVLQRVRAMIEQSEMRQQRELALRLSQVAREVDTQHQADLLRIQQNFGQQQDMMEYLVRTSGGIK